MQKLPERRPTNTPADVPQVRGNCDAPLNSPQGKDSVMRFKTSGNNPDAALTPHKGGLNSRVSDNIYVLDKQGKPLMPCSPRKARILLSTGKASMQTRTTFTIRLTIPTGETLQPIRLGLDSGYSHIGISAVSKRRSFTPTTLPSGPTS